MKNRFYNFELKPFHITGRIQLTDLKDTHTLDIWNFFLCEFRKQSEQNTLKWVSFVLMGTHFHILCYPQDKAVGEIGEHFSVSGGESFKLRNVEFYKIDNIKYYHTVYKYIYRNPVEAGLCKSAVDYPYSSLNSIVRGSPQSCVFDDDMHLIFNPKKVVEWIDTDFSEDSYQKCGYSVIM
ncbi:MAG: hypothetical protein HOO06_09390 [Bdellovibrionaceae bacterium]|jgi:putative transposase|nr:hypothetical protein [Pseudobdellovibrionaceae bacterium]